MVQLSQPYITSGKTVALTIQTVVDRVMSLLFNTLSRFFHSFPTKKQLFSDFIAAVTNCSNFRAQEEEICHCFLLSPSICYAVMGLDAMILVFSLFVLIFSLKLALSFSSFTLIKRLFSLSSLSAIRVVSSAYLRLLMFLPPILFQACSSSNLALLMMSSAYRLNKQGDANSPVILLSQS